MEPILFIDFDGTITREDIGDAFFEHFGGPVCRDYVASYRKGEISAQECFRREAAAMRPFTDEEARSFLRTKELSPGFAEFVAFCRERKIPFHILSDGLDTYISRILEDAGLGGLSVFANHLRLSPAGEGKGRGEFAAGLPDAECDRCANCKRNILLRLAGEGHCIIYVGEGYSDRCAAQYADIVFAKDDLQRFCQKENISYLPYTDFHDVRAACEGLLSRKRLRKRRRAELKRREAFTCEA
jgi:2,3-diketo-5-methylthio-1-phosphopentane phosphatase